MTRNTYFTMLEVFFICIGLGLSLSTNHIDECGRRWDLDSLSVNCSNRGFNEFPFVREGIPIEHFDLSHNHFHEFPKVYANIKTLISLDLSNNDIREISEDALIGFRELRVLILANNNIQSWSDINPSIAFQHAYNLEKLTLAGNHLAAFSRTQRAPILVSDSIVELDLSHCGLKLVNDILVGLSRLEKLILSGNKLETLLSLPSKSLRTLDVSNCMLTRVNTSLLDGLPNLEVLNLSWNPIGTMRYKRTESIRCETLRQIDISFCELSSVELSGMPNLKVARLKGNRMRSISNTMFSNNSLLEVLDLSMNTIPTLDPGTFSNLQSLTVLDLSYNIFIDFFGFTSNSLRSLNMSSCEIYNIKPRVFSGFKTLINLDLSNNTNIKYFPPNLRSETLENLDLSMCSLWDMSDETFQGFPELTSLKLSSNRFRNPLRPEYFRSNVNLNKIWLSDNQWRCDCDDRNFKAFYEFFNTKPEKVQDKKILKCSKNSILKPCRNSSRWGFYFFLASIL